MSELYGERHWHLFDVDEHPSSCKCLAKDCVANRLSFEESVKAWGQALGRAPVATIDYVIYNSDGTVDGILSVPVEAS